MNLFILKAELEAIQSLNHFCVDCEYPVENCMCKFMCKEPSFLKEYGVILELEDKERCFTF